MIKTATNAKPIPKFKDQKFDNEQLLKLWLLRTASEILHLEDNGQDLLTLWIHESGEVLHADMQSSIWTGSFIDIDRLHNESEVYMYVPAVDEWKEYDFIPANIEAVIPFVNESGEIKLSGIAEPIEIFLNDKLLNPARSQKVRNHSPDGFNYGYRGSGPAQLALAILLELTDKASAVANYQRFKFDVISGIPSAQDFSITINVTDYL